MPWVISPWNGALIEVTDNSPLLNPSSPLYTGGAVSSGSAAGASVGAPSSTLPQPGTYTNTGVNGGGATMATVTMTAEEKRREEVKKLTLSDVPEIAAIQRQAQEEYIKTGKWNDKYTQQADAIRAGLNPMYPGGGRGFDEKQYILGDGSSNTMLGDLLSSLFGAGKQVTDTATSPANNGALMLGAGALLLLLLFRR